MTYDATIGLEIHAVLKTKTKMFCSCRNDPAAGQANLHVCPVCLGHPGTLPTANEAAIRTVVRAGIALGCRIARESRFDRKNYFYPDLPKGYQISQYDQPICENGMLEAGGTPIRIRRIHLEEDAGRLAHGTGGSSFVDFNRAGVPLMELVTEPDFVSGAQARAFAQELQLVLQYLEASDADMENGLMRVEANISVRQKEAQALGTKVEVKNLNSFRALERAIAFEIARQSEILDRGERVVQETRGWDENSEETFSQRVKEEEQDYRYFPEPDIPPLQFSENDIRSLEHSLPELPAQKRARFAAEYGLEDAGSAVFIADRKLASYFEQAASELAADRSEEEYRGMLKLAANYLSSDLRGYLNESGRILEEIRMTPENFAELIAILAQGGVSSAAAKSLLRGMAETGGDPSQMIEEQGIGQVSDDAAIRDAALRAIAEHPAAVQDWRAGKENVLQFLVGKIMAATRGSANPEVAARVLNDLLREGS